MARNRYATKSSHAAGPESGQNRPVTERWIWAFDVDDTLDLGPLPGPIPIEYVFRLRNAGDLAGFCGNLSPLLQLREPFWELVDFSGPDPSFSGFRQHWDRKAEFLRALSRQHPAPARRLMVGNDLTRFDRPVSQDDRAARLAHWEYVPEERAVELIERRLRELKSNAA